MIDVYRSLRARAGSRKRAPDCPRARYAVAQDGKGASSLRIAETQDQECR